MKKIRRYIIGILTVALIFCEVMSRRGESAAASAAGGIRGGLEEGDLQGAAEYGSYQGMSAEAADKVYTGSLPEGGRTSGNLDEETADRVEEA